MYFFGFGFCKHVLMINCICYFFLNYVGVYNFKKGKKIRRVKYGNTEILKAWYLG